MSDTQTVWEALLEQLRLRDQYNPQVEVAPAATLWPDPEEEWAPLAKRLRAEMPHFLTLGEYDKANRVGPAIWIKCMLGRTLPEATWDEETIPIIYLPGVSRKDLRAVDECPDHLKPLAELQYRGVVWSQVSHRDWTLLAFLVTETGGLGLDVATDNATKEALGRAVVVLMDKKVSDLQGLRLDQSFFDNLLNPDGVQQILQWLNDPEGHRAGCDDNCWEAFRNSCKKYGFDPVADGALTAAEKVGSRQAGWETVWARFAEAPGSYPGVIEWLDKAAPAVLDGLFDDASSWPKFNAQRETQLKAALLDLADAGPAQARKAIATLETTHGERREWVWAKLGQTPFANALGHLSALAEATATPLTGATPADMAESYVAGRWRADAEVLEALEALQPLSDIGPVQTAIRAIYADWLEQAAILFQTLVTQHGLPAGEPSDIKTGCCILFADGLRYDLAQRLSEALSGAGPEHGLGWQFTALPSVTATTKPAVSPIAAMLTGAAQGTDFQPSVKADEKTLTTDRFRKLLADAGVQYLKSDETGDPAGKAWTECGTIDKRGHDEGWKLAWRVEEEVQWLLERVQSLKQAGWQEVRIVTDHGWLLLPGKLPGLELPQYLVESRWGRCAALKASSQVSMTTVPWHWNPQVQIAMAGGISCFAYAGDYAHGGLTVQECVVPVLTVKGATVASASASIGEISWNGLRIRAQIGGGAGLRLDVRTKAAEASSSVAKDLRPAVVADNGLATLVVPDDSLLGTAATVVVLDPNGEVIAKEQTVIGGSD